MCSSDGELVENDREPNGLVNIGGGPHAVNAEFPDTSLASSEDGPLDNGLGDRRLDRNNWPYSDWNATIPSDDRTSELVSLQELLKHFCIPHE